MMVTIFDKIGDRSAMKKKNKLLLMRDIVMKMKKFINHKEV